MEPLFRNSILFISGFIVALVFFRHPESLEKIKSYSFIEETESQQPMNSKDYAKSFQRNKLADSESTERPILSQNRIALNTYGGMNTHGRPSLDDVPANPDQTPTAPPTGRPEAEGEENAENDAEQKDKNQQPQVAKQNYDRYHSDAEYGEKSFSSTAPTFIGGVVVNPNGNTASKTSSSSTNGTPIYGVGSTIGTPKTDDNTDFDLSDDFTQAGLQSAKKLYNQKQITDSEYLEYISTGLESTDPTLKQLAVNALVSVKTKTGFTVQTQYASASKANETALNQAIISSYRTADDLVFLSQRIADESSQVSQSWAVNALDVVISSANMDFSNQQIRDTLVNNVYSSLVKLDASHPSFGQAQSISKDINRKIS